MAQQMQDIYAACRCGGVANTLRHSVTCMRITIWMNLSACNNAVLKFARSDRSFYAAAQTTKSLPHCAVVLLQQAVTAHGAVQPLLS